MSRPIYSDENGTKPTGFLSRFRRWLGTRIEAEKINVVETERTSLGLHDRIVNTKGRLFGLSLSGGGIRSASFALGMLQAVEDSGLLARLHYLSTVSGGGYTGSALTWFRHWGIDFPFGRHYEGSRTPDRSLASQILAFIRLHGDYLFPTRGLGPLSGVGMVVWAMFWSLAIYCALLFPIVVSVYVAVPGILASQSWLPQIMRQPWGPGAGLAVAGFFGLLLPVIGTTYVFVTLMLPSGYFGRRIFQQIVGVLIAFMMAAAVLAIVPVLYNTILVKLGPQELAGASLFGIAAGASAAFYRLYKELRGTLAKAPYLANPLIVAGSILLILGMLLGTFAVARTILGETPALLPVLTAMSVLGPALLLARLVDINRISFHGLYRDRLMEVFMPQPDAYQHATWEAAKTADKTTLSSMRALLPYHIINANVILSGSERKEYRTRGGDNFILSPLFCGSDATGYQRTEQYMRNRMTLPTAMAISGAAVNPNSGVGGQGVTRNFWVSMLLSLLNVRLGYWVRRPEQLSGPRWTIWLKQFVLFVAQGKSLHPDFYNPGLSSMMKGGGREDAYYVELSDGGHFDNTALYELVRRRLDVIVISDASADPDFTFADLGNAIERVRVDFGAQIRFGDPDFDIAGLIPKSGENLIMREKFGIARRGYAIGTIAYDPEHVGIILYIKPTMVAGLPGDVYAYRAAHAEFPHQPTSNQFFEENQLEAYRELGFQLASDAFVGLKLIANGGSPFFPSQALDAARRFFNLTGRAPVKPAPVQ